MSIEDFIAAEKLRTVSVFTINNDTIETLIICIYQWTFAKNLKVVFVSPTSTNIIDFVFVRCDPSKVIRHNLRQLQFTNGGSLITTEEKSMARGTTADVYILWDVNKDTLCNMIPMLRINCALIVLRPDN